MQVSTPLLLLCTVFQFHPTLSLAQNALAADPQQYFSSTPTLASQPLTVRSLPLRVLRDQKGLWTSPFRLRTRDLTWLLPLGATTGLLLATDRHSIDRIHSNPSNRSRSSSLSNAGLAAFAGAAALSYGLGSITHNPHARETGLLAAEAFADTFLVTEVFKLLTQRDRPALHSAQGDFWRNASLSSSFPSQHTALGWSAATVFAHEYPGPLTQWTAYGLASLVGISRVTAEKHFPSDVLVGAASGYLIGRYVYRKRHDQEMGATSRLKTGREPLLAWVAGPARPAKPSTASVYVPLDSWIYPALRRLAEFGLVPDQASNLAPWTRAECLRQVAQAAARLQENSPAAIVPTALRLISDLRTELEPPAGTDNIIRLESLYTRTTTIAGTPLRDSYHFGQTINNDFGRPYEQGFNNVSGFSSYAVAGRLTAYIRGEYQYAPGRHPLSPALSQFISMKDFVPSLGDGSLAVTNRFRPLEMYVGAQFGFENITFGKQNLWWGPGEESAFSFSNNAAPFYMLRFAQNRPWVLPGLLRYMGKIRTDIVFGKLSGHHFPARPYMTAQKISLDITPDLEIGFTRSSFFGGVGHPLTFGALKETLFGVNSVDFGPYGLRSDLPGDRHSGFDFRWRVPGLRHSVTLYSDAYADDDPNPLDNPKRAPWAPGLYFSHLPLLPRIDLRFETYSARLYAGDIGGNFLYWNNQYRDSYTNNGYLLGSWVGRDSRAYIAKSTYWASAKSKLSANYRQIKIGPAFIPGGGTQTDISLTGTWGAAPEWLLTAKVQGERCNIPLLGAAKLNVLTSIGFTYYPHQPKQ